MKKMKQVNTNAFISILLDDTHVKGILASIALSNPLAPNLVWIPDPGSNLTPLEEVCTYLHHLSYFTSLWYISLYTSLKAGALHPLKVVLYIGTQPSCVGDE